MHLMSREEELQEGFPLLVLINIERKLKSQNKTKHLISKSIFELFEKQKKYIK